MMFKHKKNTKCELTESEGRSEQKSMRCPYCGVDNDKVIESRTMANGESIRRRRECLGCGYRFTSFERIEEKPLMVIKRDGGRQPFDREKLKNGIITAFQKRRNDIPFETIVDDIEEAAFVQAGQAREIKTSELGELVLDKLHQLDKIAYIRFASVYKHFENLDEIIDEINRLKKPIRRGKK